MAEALTHKQLIEHVERYCYANQFSRVLTQPSPAYTGESPDVIAFRRAGVSWLFECKASRADFMADLDKPFRIATRREGMGKCRVYVSEPRILDQRDVIDSAPGWGLAHIINEQVQIVRDPQMWHHPYRNTDAEIDLLSTAIGNLERETHRNANEARPSQADRLSGDHRAIVATIIAGNQRCDAKTIHRQLPEEAMVRWKKLSAFRKALENSPIEGVESSVGSPTYYSLKESK